MFSVAVPDVFKANTLTAVSLIANALRLLRQAL